MMNYIIGTLILHHRKVETSETEFQPLSSQGSENPKGTYPVIICINNLSQL